MAPKLSTYDQYVLDLAGIQGLKPEIAPTEIKVLPDGSRYIGNHRLEDIYVGPGTSGRRSIVKGLGDQSDQMVRMPTPGEEYYQKYSDAYLKGKPGTAEPIGQGAASKRVPHGMDGPLNYLFGTDRDNRMRQVFDLKGDPNVNPGGNWENLPWWAKASAITPEDMHNYSKQRALGDLNKPSQTIVQGADGVNQVIEGPSLADELAAARIPLTTTDAAGKQVLVYNSDGTQAIRTVEVADNTPIIKKLLLEHNNANRKKQGYYNANGEWVPSETNRLRVKTNDLLQKADTAKEAKATELRNNAIDSAKTLVEGAKHREAAASKDQSRLDTLELAREKIAGKLAELKILAQQGQDTTKATLDLEKMKIQAEKELARYEVESQRILQDEGRKAGDNPFSTLWEALFGN